MKKDNNKNGKLILIVCFLLILLALAAGILLMMSKEKTAAEKDTMAVANAEDYTGEPTPTPDYSAIEENPSIAIPGYDTITLKAGQTEQNVSFHNPEENTCYFKMSLILPDGTTIWESDLLEPGKAFYTITLNQSLTAGNYPDTSLKYDCYSLKDQSQLNGAEIKVNLVVE